MLLVKTEETQMKKEEDYIIETEHGKQFDYDAMEYDVRNSEICPFSFPCPNDILYGYDPNDVEGCIACVRAFKEITEK